MCQVLRSGSTRPGVSADEFGASASKDGVRAAALFVCSVAVAALHIALPAAGAGNSMFVFGVFRRALTLGLYWQLPGTSDKLPFLLRGLRPGCVRPG